MLRRRILTALILAPLGIWAVLALPPLYFRILVTALLSAALWEWCSLIGLKQWPLRAALFLLFAVVIAAQHMALTQVSGPLLIIGTLWWPLIGLWLAAPKFGRRGNLGAVLKIIAALVCLISFATAVIHLRHLENGPYLLLGLLLLIWCADIGAYFFGKQWGRRKLAPQVSPGKTWVGVAGGMITAMIVIIPTSHMLGLGAGNRLILPLLAITTIAWSILGDLFLSLLKRQAGLKDSGNILPGHGGVLDRFDSLIAAAPVFTIGVTSFLPAAG